MMTRLYPLTFHPLFKERVWGGRTLETLYRKQLPSGVPIGESWEISDRPGDESVIANGPLAGRSLRWLMEQHDREILGDAKPADGNRFPILCKILDARDRLSLQVHPPARAFNQLGEPKTEMWYIARAEPGAELYAGLKGGVTREAFEEELRRGTVADCIHRFPVRTGDTMFLPSGRVHAIGAGLVIFEIQQNSDTTFRVFDWNRVGLDGRPRDLHVAESLESIDFGDVEPSLAGGDEARSGEFQARSLVRDALFNTDLIRSESMRLMALPPRLRIVAMVDGAATMTGGSRSERLQPGQFCIMPACVMDGLITADAGSEFLLVEPGK